MVVPTSPVVRGDDVVDDVSVVVPMIPPAVVEEEDEPVVN